MDPRDPWTYIVPADDLEDEPDFDRDELGLDPEEDEDDDCCDEEDEDLHSA